MNTEYWDKRYIEGQTGWDIGGPSNPLVSYLDQIKNKDLHILFPGAGLAWDAEYAFDKGFKNTFVADVSEKARSSFFQRVPSFPKENYILGDFFELEESFDLIIEQTFYCALPPKMRDDYVVKMHDLLKPYGKLVGVLFTFPLTEDGPPFGGSLEEYQTRFSNKFDVKVLEECNNSIKPRMGREAFLIAEKPEH